MVEQASTELVGREGVLDELTELLKLAEAGSPRIVLLTGETGVGKTRVVQELARRSTTVLAGSCVPMSGDPVPFAPLRQGLRQLAGHGVVRQDVARHPVLARLSPQAPGAEDGDAANPAALFHAVLELLSHLGSAGPLLHVVEDLHWADGSTLDLLRYLAVNFANEPVLVLATCRDDAIEPGSPLATWLAEVGRLDISHRIALERLDAQDTARLVAALTGGATDPEVVETTMERSAGNPLFVEHLVLQGGSGDLPATLRELLATRVETLPTGTQELLGAVAVLGRPSESELLATVLGRTADEVELQARPALVQHVLELRDGRALGMRHPAFLEVVYAGLLPAERQRLHRAAALAIEAGETDQVGETGRAARDPGSAGDLARHWTQAGNPDKALDASVRAGRAAEQMYAFAAARTWFARAADLARLTPSVHTPRELLSRAAEAASLSGDTADAVRLGEQSLELAGTAYEMSDLCERLGTYEYLAGRGVEAERRYRRALDLIVDEPATPLTARVYAGLALYAAAWSRLDEGASLAERGMALAREVGARREEGRLHVALGVVASTRGDNDGGVAHLREALAIAQEVRNAHDLGTAYVNLSHVLALACRWEELVEAGLAGMAAMAEVGLARQRGSILRANTCEALISLGRLTQASALLADPHVPPARGIMAAPPLLQSARIAALGGDLRQAWDRVSEARAIVESEGAPDSWLRGVHEMAALIELWSGRPAAAHEIVLEGLRLIAGGDEERLAQHLAVLGMWALADQAEMHRDVVSRRRLLRLVPPLDEAMARGAPRTEAAAYAVWFHAERARLSRRADVSSWEAVAQEWERVGHPVRALYARWREVELRLDRGVDAAAIDALRNAHRTASGLGVRRMGDELERLASWHRIELPDAADAADAADTPARADVDAAERYGLTARELEVLSRLAAGRTNREIGEELFISVKTASVHVSNILRKLDVAGRQEAARVAHRLGL